MVFNTATMKQKIKSIVISNSAKIGSIFTQLSKNKILNPKKYELLMCSDDLTGAPEIMAKDLMGDFIEEKEPDPLEEDDRIIDQ